MKFKKISSTETDPSKVISYSLWGNKEFYTYGAIHNVYGCAFYYPEWTARFYVQQDVDQTVKEILCSAKNTEVYETEDGPSEGGMFWRFLPAFEDGVDIMLSRDCDSRITEREVFAVKDWLQSDKDFHIMRDHPHHTSLVMGGMWGCRNGILRGLKDRFDNFRKSERWGLDQMFLNSCVYPEISTNAKVHSECVCFNGENSETFPTKRLGKYFVGQRVSSENFPMMKDCEYL